ncbi:MULTISPECIES: squalene monooxygenase [Methylococcus]|uniref:squalene monooxygenase n=1 Tax=Methylococcus capsulatus TaxID=414 RepID=A0ABZ2F8N8_METCP|nr:MULTISPECIES: squalene monooxygenase [Methylococcus]MDF9393677.1 FAD-dependent oxidoreductase [Methylococcus capsulatus]
MSSIELSEWDVLIAGGSVAGSAAAAALSGLGLRVLIVEPDPDPGRRLAGELIHPPGIDGLLELGLIRDDAPRGSVVNGFAIFPFNDGAGAPATLLPYGEIHGRRRCGRVIEHSLLKSHLLRTVHGFDRVTVWLGARVTGMAQVDGKRYVATVTHAGTDVRVESRLIIGADGPMSQLRKMVGISHETQRYSGMIGIEVDDAHLPNPGYGNIFLNPAGVSYAYGIGGGRARVMFEVLKGADSKESIRDHLRLFPEPFRSDIEAVLAQGKPLAAANYCIVPESSVKANVALIGDARGCCHPLTASGITAAVKDAFVMRDALQATGLNFEAALKRYAVQCCRLQLTRRTLAEELREAFLAQTPEAELLSQCIFSYWRNSPKGRQASMALLSTLDSSIFSLASQYALVGLQAFRLLPQWLSAKMAGDWLRGVAQLVSKSLKFQQDALNQALRAK